MPYFVENREELDQIRKKNVCADCGSSLLPYYYNDSKKFSLECSVNREHQGIARQYLQPKELNIISRREALMNEHGEEKGKSLMKHPTTGQLTEYQAIKILRLVYPNVPDNEIVRTAILCKDFGLHPLMKEVYIIPFKDKKTGTTTYSTVLGINATRKMMARFGTFSYVDNTPRVMTEKEQEQIFGEIYNDRIYAITKLRTKDGLEAQGYGFWLKEQTPYGTDKGNTKANMAFIRSERQAFNRLFPDSLPQDVDLVDEAFVDEPRIVDKSTGEIIDGEVIEEEPEPDDMIDIPEEAVFAEESERDESLVSEEQLETLKKEIKDKLGWNLSDLGSFMKREKGWTLSKLAELKVWQYEEIILLTKKGS